VADYRYRFLNVGEVRPRKNHLGLLRAWLTATRPEDDAVLILKCLSPDYVLIDVAEDIARMQAHLGRGFGDAAPVIFLNRVLTDDELRALYCAATQYVSMSDDDGTSWCSPVER
jgi:hypothetical protein